MKNSKALMFERKQQNEHKKQQYLWPYLICHYIYIFQNIVTITIEKKGKRAISYSIHYSRIALPKEQNFETLTRKIRQIQFEFF